MSNIISNDNKIAFHPGYYVEQYLNHQGMKQNELAERLGVSEKTVSHLINGKLLKLSTELIKGLSIVFGTSEELWENINNRYLKIKEEIEDENKLNEDAKIVKQMDYSFWTENDLLSCKNKTIEKVKELRKYLKIATLQVLKNKDFLVQFKTAIPEVKEKNVINANAWVQTALNMGNLIEVDQVNLEYLKSQLDNIRQMTLEEPQVFLPKLQDILKKSGVAFVMLPNLKNCGINGAVKWIGKDKVLLALNDRRKYSDVFWFALFHEIKHVFQKKKGHIIITSDNDALLSTSGINVSMLEQEADEFAKNILINPKNYNEFIVKGDFSRKAVLEFSNKIGIHPGIVVGRLQKEEYIECNQLNDLKEKYRISLNNFV